MSGFEPLVALVSLSIAVPGVVETFIHASRHLLQKLRSEPMIPEVARIQDFIVFLNRGTMRKTLEIVEDLYCDTTDNAIHTVLDEKVRQIWDVVLKLDKDIYNEKDGAKQKKAMKGALGRIDELYKLEDSLRRYLQLQATAWTVRSRLELRSNQFSVIGQPTKLPHSPVSTARVDFRTISRQGLVYSILEEKCFPGLSSDRAYETAKDLARVLQFTKASQGLLELAGFQVLSRSPLFDDDFRLVFPFPADGVNPRSLRNILLDPVNIPLPPIPRNYRFILPRKLAESVYHVHQHNLVHKGIRPESIVLFEPKPKEFRSETRYPNVIGDPCLIDWRYIRKTVDASGFSVDNDWTLALYQHPERQAGLGGLAESKYNIGHDIYSFGVCLLEIGLWESFVRYDGDTPSLSPTLSTARASWMTENAAAAEAMTDSRIDQQVFLMLAGQKLAYEMGEAYSRMVIKCLSCLENGFGNVLMFVDSQSRDWDEQGVLFIQEIRRQLTNASTMGVGSYNLIS